MRIGLFSDVHGNLPALEAVLKSLTKENCDVCFCGGDIVGYGADPCACIEVIQSKSIASIAGNHDWAALGKIDTTYFNPLAQEAVLWTSRQLQNPHKDFLERLPLVLTTEFFNLTHGTLDAPENFSYVTGVHSAMATFQLMDRNICFVGHLHVPFFYMDDGRSVQESPLPRIPITQRNKYIVNVGSVGQPRDGNPGAAYCVFDTTEQVVRIERVAYDVVEAQQRIRKAGLPWPLAERLAYGQ